MSVRSSDHPALDPAESCELASVAARARRADEELAAALRRPGPTGPGLSARYLDVLGRQPPLPRELERRLVAAAQAGDQRARGRLVEAFLPVLASASREFAGSPGVDRVELTQEGVVGLLRALERYDPAGGTSFWSLARAWVRHAMQRLVAEAGDAVILSERALRGLAGLKRAHEELRTQLRREPSLDEVAGRAGIGAADASRLFAAMRPPSAGGDVAVGMFGDLVRDPLGGDEYQRVLDAIEAPELVLLLSALSERERLVLRERFGLAGQARTARQIGERVGLGDARVRDLERRALGKLARAAQAAGVP